MPVRIRPSRSEDMPTSSGLAVGSPDFANCATARPSPVTTEKRVTAISEKKVMRFMPVSSENQFVVPPLGGSFRRHGMDLRPRLPPKGGTTNCAFHSFRASQRHMKAPQKTVGQTTWERRHPCL